MTKKPKAKFRVGQKVITTNGTNVWKVSKVVLYRGEFWYCLNGVDNLNFYEGDLIAASKKGVLEEIYSNLRTMTDSLEKARTRVRQLEELVDKLK